MNWGYFLDIASRIGWSAAEFWQSSMWDLSTAVAAYTDMHMPKKPQALGDDELGGMLENLARTRPI